MNGMDGCVAVVKAVLHLFGRVPYYSAVAGAIDSLADSYPCISPYYYCILGCLGHYVV